VAGIHVNDIEAGIAGPQGPLAVPAAEVANIPAAHGAGLAGLAAAAFLEKNPDPTEEDVRRGMTNLCRCGTYTRIVEGVLRAAEIRKAGGTA